MPLETLTVASATLPASYGTSRTAEPKLRVSNFGDGYEQVAPAGLDHNLLTLNVSFSAKTADERAEIVTFLDARAGVEAFRWTPPAPYATERIFRCKTWSDGWDEFDSEIVNAVFQEVKIPGES